MALTLACHPHFDALKLGGKKAKALVQVQQFRPKSEFLRSAAHGETVSSFGRNDGS
jgi:hypothetical protein